ncbi:hypothetical protein NP233_g5387 [Leucocoprinus birnbaumii]|uniref:NACHT domain-containing protein n=1 Tax=Leucocoprinus birnbaumii TaxID=56174 RepID=A0AAD5VSZ2_9AGAR|nr:hypothetical protein NP233_g5387 [Leucocoprinus birnbaumii]
MHRSRLYRAPQQRIRPGIFQNPHDFVVKDSLLLQTTKDDNFMEKFAKHTIQGAELDSSARDPPPRCHPDTRISILKRMELWLRNPYRSKRMLWLVGPAGVGKSAIMQTVAENECKASLLAALFFSAPNGRNDPRRVITTLAYQLATSYPPYYNYVRAMITANPKVLEKSIVGQFTDFIVKPFAVRRLFDGTYQVLIFIDGMDECKGEHEQILLLSLISYFTTRFPDAPLLWVISSRPEAHITHHLSRRRLASCFDKEEVPIDSPEACQDVERFFRAEFAKIRGSSSVMMSHFPEWPPERLLLKLLAAAQGLFAYADTAIRFIAERDHINRFQLVVNLIDQPSSFTPDSTVQPLARLDSLYHYIISQIDPEDLKYAKHIFSFLLFPPDDYVVDMTQSLMCDWLEMSPDVLHNSLCKLHSVLSIPPPDEPEEMIDWHHKSFYDFLHRMRSQLGLPVDRDDASEVHRQHLIRILNRIPLTDSPMTPGIPRYLLTWPYQTLEELEKGQESFSGFLLWVDVGRSGINGLSHEPSTTSDVLHAVKAITGVHPTHSGQSSWMVDIFVKLAKQLRDDGSLLDLPAEIFLLDSVENDHFEIFEEYEDGDLSHSAGDLAYDQYLYIMDRWKSNAPEVILETFIGNRLRGVVNCTPFMSELLRSDRYDFNNDIERAIADGRKIHLYLYYDFSAIYATLQEQEYIITK